MYVVGYGIGCVAIVQSLSITQSNGRLSRGLNILLWIFNFLIFQFLIFWVVLGYSKVSHQASLTKHVKISCHFCIS